MNELNYLENAATKTHAFEHLMEAKGSRKTF
jgi:hypothetical protein